MINSTEVFGNILESLFGRNKTTENWKFPPHADNLEHYDKRSPPNPATPLPSATHLYDLLWLDHELVSRPWLDRVRSCALNRLRSLTTLT